MRVLLTLLFYFFTFHLIAQDIPVLSGYSIGFGAIYTSKNEMMAIPQGIDGIALSSKGRLGYEGNLSCQIRMGANTSIDGSFMIGAYPVNIKYDLKKEYIGGENDITTLPKSTAYIKYTGVKIGLGRYFKIKDNLFSIVARGSIIYFTGDWNLQNRYIGDIDPALLVYKRVFIPNREDKLIIAPELNLKYYKKLGRRLWLYFYLTGTYSSARPIEGTYEIFGENETLTGEFSKRYAHIGLGAGVFFSKKIKKEN